jgi:hypothetical protein
MMFGTITERVRSAQPLARTIATTSIADLRHGVTATLPDGATGHVNALVRVNRINRTIVDLYHPYCDPHVVRVHLHPLVRTRPTAVRNWLVLALAAAMAANAEEPVNVYGYRTDPATPIDPDPSCMIVPPPQPVVYLPGSTIAGFQLPAAPGSATVLIHLPEGMVVTVWTERQLCWNEAADDVQWDWRPCYAVHADVTAARAIVQARVARTLHDGAMTPPVPQLAGLTVPLLPLFGAARTMIAWQFPADGSPPIRVRYPARSHGPGRVAKTMASSHSGAV